MNEMLTKNLKLNLFSEFAKHIWVCCGLVMLLLMSGSAWAQTAGETCGSPLVVTALPFTASGNTSTYGDNYEKVDVPALAPGAITNGTSSYDYYITGDDVVFSYTPTSDLLIRVTTTNDDDWIGLLAFTGCPFASTIGYHTATSGTTRAINGLPVLAGTTYYFVISTWPSPQSTGFTINIQEDVPDCLELGLNIGSACDDGDSGTYGDVVDEDCNCVGTPYDCQSLEANIGDPCDDGNSNTTDDVVNESCVCEGVIPPVGSACEAPIEFTSLPYVTTDNTENYGDNYGSGDRPLMAPGAIGTPSASYLNGDDVVYAYSPTADGFVDIVVTEHGTWAGVFVFTGCAPFESTLGGHTNSSATVDLEVIGLPVEAGVTYYIVISTYAAPQSTPYTLNVTPTVFDCPALNANIGGSCDDGDANTVNDTVTEDCECVGTPAASNNEACSATAIACGDDIEQTLIGASSSMTDACSGTGSADVWFSFTSDGSQSIIVAETSSLDVVVQLFKGDDCANLLEARACADSPENYTVTEAGTYYFRVRPYYESGNEGTISVSLTCLDIATNNDACTATAMDCGDDIVQSLSGLTASFTDNCGGSGTTDAWFSFSTDGSQIVVVSETSALDAIVQLFVGDDCGNIVQAAACKDSPENYTVTEAGTYYFRVRPYSSTNNNAAIAVSLTCMDMATNNDACTSTAMVCGDNIQQSLLGLTSSTTDNCNGTGSTDAWFSFYTDGSQILTVAETSSFDAIVQLFVGDDCGNLVEAGACKDSPEDYKVTEAGTYYFRVRPYSSTNNNATIAVSLTCVPYDCPTERVNFGDACDDGNATTLNDVIGQDCSCAGTPAAPGDLCTIALPIDCNAAPVTYSSTNSNASNNTVCAMGSKGLWFSFMGTGGDITINSTASFDHEMSINKGDCAALENVGCKDGSTGAETYTIPLSEDGQMYYVYIAHYSATSTTTGNITIDIDCAIPPACTVPEMLLAVQDVNGNAIEGCLEFGGVYYVTVRLSGGAGNDSYNVSANAAAAIEVAAGGSVVLGPYNLGTNVNVSTVGVQDAMCYVSATANSPAICPPSNDNCDSAEALVCGQTIVGSTANATASGLSATCGNYTSSSALDVFYSFEADGTSDYTVSLDAATSTSFDGILFVYSGTCGNLTSLGCSDSGNPEEMELLAPAAGTYIVRVFRYTTSGTFTLGLECIGAQGASLGGSVNWNSACDERDATVQLYEPGTAILVESYDVSIQNDGSFNIAELEIGTFDVIVKVDGYLAKGTRNVVIAAGENSLAVGAIVFGDLNDNNIVDFVDLGILLGAYLSQSGQTEYNPIADANCNGIIDFVDLGVLSGSYLMLGDSAPLAP